MAPRRYQPLKGSFCELHSYSHLLPTCVPKFFHDLELDIKGDPEGNYSGNNINKRLDAG